jgi:hypothetical protein
MRYVGPASDEEVLRHDLELSDSESRLSVKLLASRQPCIVLRLGAFCLEYINFGLSWRHMSTQSSAMRNSSPCACFALSMVESIP